MESDLAIFGGHPVLKNEFPPYNTIGEDEINSAIEVMKTGVLSGYVANPGPCFFGGKWTIELEKLFTEKFGTKFAVSVNSATSGLHAAVAAAGLGPGDEMIVSPYTMSASATSAVMCGATPVFVDIEPDTFCIDIEKVKKLITKKTKAIMAVNIFGMPCQLEELRQLADKHNLFLIEDNAQALAAQYNKKWAGTIGHMGIFSFNRHKTIQSGEGGVVLTNDPLLAKRLRMVRNHGEVVLADWEQELGGNEDVIGYNYRLTELQSAIAIPQVKRMDELNLVRIELANYLSKQLSQFNFLQPVRIREKSSHVYYLYPILFNANNIGISRDKFVQALKAEGMPVANYVRPLYYLPLYSKKFGNLDCYNPKNFPVVENLWRESMIVTSICRPPLSTQHIDLFISAIQKIVDNIKYLKD